MSDVLRQIIANKMREVEHAKKHQPLSALKAMVDSVEPALDFHAALTSTKTKIRVIAECKKKSPSKGILKEEYEPVDLALLYEKGGAAAISVLTDTNYFGGKLDDLARVKENVSLPVLRKDFIIDEYQIYEARRHGADTFLLLASEFDSAKLQYFIEIGRDLGMEPLVEAHSDQEIQIALKTDCKILGINNRDLKTMKVDPEYSRKAAESIAKSHPDRVLVCESGIKTREDIELARTAGFHAFLIGETLVTSKNPSEILAQLII